MNTRKRFALASVLMASMCSTAFAQVVPFEVEGKLTYVDIKFVGTTGTIDAASSIKCNGATIFLTGATTISTPTNTITGAQLISPKAFPGRAVIPASDAPAPGAQKSAFMGGTCIVQGEDDQTPTGRKATALFVEPAENVLVGPTTNLRGTAFEILGVKVKLLGMPPAGSNEPAINYLPDFERRIVARSPINANGFAIKLSTVDKGDEASAEGYLSDDRKTFYAFAVETTGGEPVIPAGTPAVAILRADMRLRSATSVEIEVRGGCTEFAQGGQTINLEFFDTSTPTIVTPASTTCLDGTYRYRNQQFPISSASAAPVAVRASVASNPGFYTDDIILERIGF